MWNESNYALIYLQLECTECDNIHPLRLVLGLLPATFE